MRNQNLKIFATAYDATGKMSSYAIGIGTKWIGWVKRNGDRFEATVGPAKASRTSPEEAARDAWIAFCEWQGPVAGMVEPGTVNLEQDRLTLRTTGKAGFDIYIGDKVSGEVVRLADGRFRASIEGVEHSGVCAMAASRLAWIKKIDGRARLA